MKKMRNDITMNGYVFDFKLDVKVGKDSTKQSYGKSFISGYVDIAVNEAGTNIVRANFGYVTPEIVSPKGTFPNRAYEALKFMIDHPELTWSKHGHDGCLKVSVGGQYSVNDYKSQASGEMVCRGRIEGRQMKIVNEIPMTNGKSAIGAFVSGDALITSVYQDEPDETNPNKKLYTHFKSFMFNYKNALLPIEFVYPADKTPSALLDNEMPMAVQITGQFYNMSVETFIPVQNMLDPNDTTSLATSVKSRVDMILMTSINIDNCVVDEDSVVITPAEYREAIQARELVIAEARKRSEEYQATKEATPVAATTLNVPMGNFELGETPMF